MPWERGADDEKFVLPLIHALASSHVRFASNATGELALGGGTRVNVNSKEGYVSIEIFTADAQCNATLQSFCGSQRGDMFKCIACAGNNQDNLHISNCSIADISIWCQTTQHFLGRVYR